MPTIDKNYPPTIEEIEVFLKGIDFKLPIGFIDFFKETNGASISTDEKYIDLWPLTNMIQLNMEYNVAIYAPGFFIFGSDGGDTAYAIEKLTGYVFEVPFIGMSKEESILICKSFDDFIRTLLQ